MDNSMRSNTQNTGDELYQERKYSEVDMVNFTTRIRNTRKYRRGIEIHRGADNEHYQE
jgi:hypothetical protein